MTFSVVHMSSRDSICSPLITAIPARSFIGWLVLRTVTPVVVLTVTLMMETGDSHSSARFFEMDHFRSCMG